MAGDVGNGAGEAGEAGEAGDVFSHTRLIPVAVDTNLPFTAL